MNLSTMIMRQFTRRNYGARISSSCMKPNMTYAIHERQRNCPTVESRRYQMTESVTRQTVNFKIKQSDVGGLVSQSLKQRTNVNMDDLEISYKGETMVFNLTWLRDSCHCNLCTHPHSRQRLYIAKDFKQDHFQVRQLDIVSADDRSVLDNRIIIGDTESGLLRIEWSDGHESFYSLSWLTYAQGFCSQSKLNDLGSIRKIQFDFPQDDFYLPKPEKAISTVQWNVEDLLNGLQPVDYSELIDGFIFSHKTKFINANRLADMSSRRSEAITKLITSLVKYGLAKIVNVPCERDHVLKVAKSLAYERPTGYGVVFDVVVEPSEQINLAYSSREFDLHTDLPYREMSPGVQLLHCISNTTHGGLSYYSDAFLAANLLKQVYPQLFEVLARFPISFVVKDPYRDMKFRRHQPIIQLDHAGELKSINYSPFTLPPLGHPDDVKLFYLAQDLFTGYLQANDNKFVTKMEPGDLYIFHNRRVLHGRSGYDATKSRRFLQGCYMDWDEIEAFDEKIRSQ